MLSMQNEKEKEAYFDNGKAYRSNVRKQEYISILLRGYVTRNVYKNQNTKSVLDKKIYNSS